MIKLDAKTMMKYTELFWTYIIRTIININYISFFLHLNMSKIATSAFLKATAM